MPPFVFALAAAAGFYAASRLIAAMIGQAPPDQMPTGEPSEHAAASDRARDLGQLEWDDAAGVYRPKI
ncbi:MAG: hypothetical protein ACM3L9_04235 [Deltaproteobacteria bacterium]